MSGHDGAGGCDFCARTGVPIKRRYRGLRYCATCYAREFKPRTCPKCGHTARLPIDQEIAVCRTCERSAPCTRCGKVDQRRGRTTKEGRLCGACAQRLRAPEPCELCGAMSNRLARNKALGHDLRVCPRCARAKHGTCGACGRHRALEATPGGQRLCRRCHDDGERPCETCGRAMPAGYGLQCRQCEATARARNRIEHIAATLEPRCIAEHFASFGDWLVERVGPERAARDAERHAGFFEAIGETWGDIPDYAALVAHFSAEGLRRQRRVLRWMAGQSRISVNATAREDDSERRRIAASLDRLPKGSKARSVMNDYGAELGERVRAGKLSRRSMRLAITPAAALLEAARAAEQELPSQETLDALLRKVPGQRAALAGFVRWLRETHGITLALAPRRTTTALNKRREAARREMLALLCGASDINDIAKRWQVAALRYFHDVSLKAAREARDHDVQTDRGGLLISIKGEAYWIPSPEVNMTNSVEK